MATFITLTISVGAAPSIHGEESDREAPLTLSSYSSLKNEGTITIQSGKLSDEDAAFIAHVGDASEVFVEKDGKIALSVSDETLENKYNFDNKEIHRLHQDVLGKPVRQALDESNVVTPRASVDGKAVCFSHEDLAVGAGVTIVAAADARPAAIAAALEAASSAFGGQSALPSAVFLHWQVLLRLLRSVEER
ncbi:hypothetical protein ACGE24_03000 [Corynebacterium kroppenstedtii]|uniref:hypothetical protein n=1 Tax=Corynebacterium sp. PCR 32 TaxID=3351342 RepID=UPI0030B2DD13